MDAVHPFLQAFRGEFSGILRWEQLDALWAVLQRDQNQHWYVYAVGEPPPSEPLSQADLTTFIAEIDALLRRDHKEDYCGVVYADQPENPSFVKVFDPHNLGVSCGFSNSPPLPGWVLSLQQPIDLPLAVAPTKSRKRWWQKIFS